MRVFVAWITLGIAALSASPRPERHWADERTNALGAPSPDGRYLSFADAATGSLGVRETATGAIRTLTKSAPGQFAYFSSVSPDSKRIAYAWFNKDRFYELRVLGIDGANDVLLYRNEEAGFVQPCAWSPDGRFVLTLLFRKDNISQIALIPTDGGVPRVLKSLNWIYPKRMDFSPDGKHIVYDAFARNGSRQRDIFLLAADGSKELLLVESPADDLFPLFSPDGEHVYFASDRNGAMGLWRVSRSGGDPELVHAGIGRFLPMGLTRAGLLFFGLREGDTDLYTASLDGGPATRAPTKFPGRNSTPEWSPDGKLIAFLSRRGTENYGQESRTITIRDQASGQERDVRAALSHIEHLRWSPDGRQLLASGSDGKGRSGLFLVDVATGRLTPVFNDPEASFRGFDGAFQPDGKVVYVQGKSLWREGKEVRTLECEPRLPAAAAPAIAFACGSDVYVMRPDGSELVRAARVSEKHAITAVRWAPSGDLLFASGPAVFRAPAGGEASLMRTIRESHGDISLHPEGKTLMFTAGVTRSEVWTLRVAR